VQRATLITNKRKYGFNDSYIIFDASDKVNSVPAHPEKFFYLY